MAEEAAKDLLVENVTEAVKNVTEKIPATPEGMALAYSSLVIMALIPIYLGSYRSIKHQAETKASGEKLDTMTTSDAMMFPLIASCALFVLYIIFNAFDKEYVNLLVSCYFFVLGIFAMTRVFAPVVSRIMPASIPNHEFHLYFSKELGDKKEDLMNYKFNTCDIVSACVCTVLASWYLIKKHWIANNLIGLSFSVSGVEMLHLNSFKTGAMLLGGLFFYDIFWVFGTDVMVTVAKSFDAPIKLVFPQDLLEHGFTASNFAMLGLGDIVIPGIFIALLLRFDKSLNRGSDTYFKATFGAYLAGLLTTIFVMHVFKHAQPALLYLVPACILAPAALALISGDIKAILSYKEEEEVDEKKEN